VHFAPPSWRHQVTALVKSAASARASRTATPAVKLTTGPLSPVGADGPPADPFAGAKVATVTGSTVLRITVDYLFTYVVEPPGDPANWMRVVQQLTGTVDFGRWEGQGSSFAPWYDVSGSAAGARCDTSDGYIHPDYSTGPPSTVQPSGKPVNPYSLATAAPGGGCSATTGT